MTETCPDIIMPCADGCPKAAYAFVPIQNVNYFFDPETALMAGTIFPDLAIHKGQYGPWENVCE